MKAIRYPAAALLLGFFQVLPARAADRLLGYEEWSRPRSADAVLQLPAVAGVMRDWQQAVAGSRVRIRYPGGEEGNLWALELRDWLVTLGLPSDRISVSPGSAHEDELVLSVVAERG